MLSVMLDACVPGMAEVRRGAAPDGTLLTEIACAASDLTEVRGRDILLAWDAAGSAARSARRGAARAFRLHDRDGGWMDVSPRDCDALCWADAVERTVGTATVYGVSVCLRLLALVDLLARAPCLIGLHAAGRTVRLPASLARLAAESPLNDDASFDEAWFRARLTTDRVRAAGQLPSSEDPAP